MDKNSNEDSCFQTEKQQIIDLLLLDVEKFRLNAQESCRNFSKDNRSLLDSISSDLRSSSKILEMYMSDTFKKVIFLQKNSNNTVFQKYITKNLAIDDQVSVNKVGEIINTRINEIKNDFIIQLFPDSELFESQIYNLKKLLNRSESEIDEIRKQQVNYLLNLKIAKSNDITIFDPYSSLINKIFTKRRIKKEQKMNRFNNRKRLLAIEKRISEIASLNNGIIADIEKNNWELMEIISLRNTYEKMINQLSKKQNNNAVNRLELFDQITQQFKNKQLEKNLIESDNIGLELTRKKIKEIDALLLRIFDLSNLQKNQLILQMKEYRDLLEEQKNLRGNSTNKN